MAKRLCERILALAQTVVATKSSSSPDQSAEVTAQQDLLMNSQDLQLHPGALPAKQDGLRDSEGPSPLLQSMSARAGRCAVVMAPIILTSCQPAVLDPKGI